MCVCCCAVVSWLVVLCVRACLFKCVWSFVRYRVVSCVLLSGVCGFVMLCVCCVRCVCVLF